MGELRDVAITLASNSKIHKVIDVIIMDILESCGVLLRREWSSKLNGYFETNWSHLWKPNKIKVELEWYMKHVVMDLMKQMRQYYFIIPLWKLLF